MSTYNKAFLGHEPNGSVEVHFGSCPKNVQKLVAILHIKVYNLEKICYRKESVGVIGPARRILWKQ